MEEPRVAQVFILSPKLPNNLMHSLCMKLFMRHYDYMFVLPQSLCLLLLHFLILRRVYLTTNFFHLKIFSDKLISGNTRMINSEEFILLSKPFWICLVLLKEIKQNLHNAVLCTFGKVNTVGNHEEFQLLEFNPWAFVVWGFQLPFRKSEDRMIFF